jgi:hypothetical protein
MTDTVTEIDDRTLDNAIDVLRRLVSDNDSKLRYGIRQREMIRQQIARGERPNHYRYEWLLATVKDLFEFLGDRCQKFNEDFPQDRCSQQDLYDVLNSALTRVKQPK